MSYKVTKLYQVTKNHISLLEPEECNPFAFQALNGLNTKLYVAILKDKEAIGLNYSRMVTDQSIANIDDWLTFADSLTDALIEGYSETIPGYAPGSDTPNNQAVAWDVMNTLRTFKVSYADHNTGLADLYVYRWNLPDLKITIWDGITTPSPVLKNSIPIVNGLFCRPVFRENDTEMYALNGAKLNWGLFGHMTPELQLVDFSDLGEVSTKPIKYKEVKPEHFQLRPLNGAEALHFNSAWSLVSPVSLLEYTPIVVICGIPIFPSEYEVTSEYTITFEPSKFPLNYAAAYRAFFIGEPNSAAGIAFDAPSLLKYISDETTKELSDSCFVILIKTPRVYFSKTTVDLWENRIIANLYLSEGLLRHKLTGTIRNYHTQRYSDRKELTFQNSIEFMAADKLFQDNQMSFIKPACFHKNLQNLQDSVCEMVYLMN